MAGLHRFLDARRAMADVIVSALLLAGAVGVVVAGISYLRWTPDTGAWTSVDAIHDGSRDPDGAGWNITWSVDGQTYRGTVPRLEFVDDAVAIEVQRDDPARHRLRSSSDAFGAISAAAVAGVIAAPAVLALVAGWSGRLFLRARDGCHLRRRFGGLPVQP